MSCISLNQADAVISAALAKGAELGLRPLSVVVLDAGGYLIASKRQDGGAPLLSQIAIAKASGGLLLGVSSRKVAEVAAEGPSIFASFAAMSPHGVVPAAGGVIVVDAEGVAIGAVGVSGDTSDNDELCTLAGIAGAGLSPQR